MEKPLLKITFKELTNVFQNGLMAKAKFIILNEIQHYGEYFFYTCYFDGQKISSIKKSEIKSIEFIQPNEL